MIRILFFTLLVSTTLSGQDFSNSLASTETFLGFESEKSKPSFVYIDESSSLIWQNTKYLKRFKNQSKAQSYCRNLRINQRQWSLPLASELKSLEITSQLLFSRDVSYLAADRPTWDNRRVFVYDSKRRRPRSVVKSSKVFYVRCVAKLEY